MLRAMDWSYASRDFVTQMAQIAQIFCIAALAEAGAVFLFLLALAGRDLVNLVDYFPSWIVRVRGWLKSCRFL